LEGKSQDIKKLKDSIYKIQEQISVIKENMQLKATKPGPPQKKPSK